MTTEFPKRFPVRFTEEEKHIYEQLVESAKRNRRSLNAEILKALEFYLKNKQDNGKKTK